ncbi:endoplasmic reticulum-Golgi intermediate compartment protein 3-like [Babylonia areolata]|uniref:endoplasmic reticulum-Golgi intermediate compartment protein 3-like n=1 Tax=Babylonia areolata TaxID=304850 RepID=UPI003FCFDB68
MQANGIFDKLRRFDAYPRTLEDFRVKTFGGAIITLLSSAVMAVLFISELNEYLSQETQQELFVDTSRGQKLRINIDITFSHLPCGYLSIDAMDVSGEQQIDLDTSLFKQRLDATGKEVGDTQETKLKEEEGEGEKEKDKVQKEKADTLDPNRCESCYGAELDDKMCCNTCEAVRAAYRLKGWALDNPDSIEQCRREGWLQRVKGEKGEGCRAHGYLQVNKVAGNFHLAPGKSFQQHHVHVHDIQAFGGQKFNLSHRINHLSFGNDYPGIVNPLDGAFEAAGEWQMMYQYHVKIVPTTYISLSSEALYTNQFSVTKHSRQNLGDGGEDKLPGVFFVYEVSPMMVKFTEKRRSFMHFLTGICAIVGGVFTVAGLIDSLIYQSAKAIQRKIELGKTS